MRWFLIGIVILVLVTAAILISRARRTGTILATPTPNPLTNTLPFTTAFPISSSIPNSTRTTPIPTRIPTPVGTTSTITTLPQTGVGTNLILMGVGSIGLGVILVKRFKLL